MSSIAYHDSHSKYILAGYSLGVMFFFQITLSGYFEPTVYLKTWVVPNYGQIELVIELFSLRGFH